MVLSNTLIDHSFLGVPWWKMVLGPWNNYYLSPIRNWFSVNIKNSTKFVNLAADFFSTKKLGGFRSLGLEKFFME